MRDGLIYSIAAAIQSHADRILCTARLAKEDAARVRKMIERIMK
jgi:hypothetical protein